MSETEEEYELQHYGFSIAELKEETTTMIRDEIVKACDFLVSNISSQVDTNIATEIDRKKNNLARNIEELFKESFDEMGSVIKEHFSIPPNVTLDVDQLKLKCIDADEKQLQEQHDDLLNRLMMLEQFNSTLQDEIGTHNKMELIINRQKYAVEEAEEKLSEQPDVNYIKELRANVNTKFVD